MIDLRQELNTIDADYNVKKDTFARNKEYH
jgi:hypothetical protein